ncbi:hypothetical protein R3P38DRAFT_3496339 [Favolaschia claudopus]|uniref:Uncharacterized protein n=1 Tax=Favolaschia claudopus TaxID=2862362 RepID=A0AAW0C8N2_9AGAR
MTQVGGGGMGRRSPLDVAELLHLTISFLAGSTPDLLACALVARRSGVYAAQSILFRAPHRTNARLMRGHPEGVLSTFYDALINFPHLVQYVREFELNAGLLCLSWIQRLCTIPFTRLESVTLCMPASAEMQNLLVPPVQQQSLRPLALMADYIFWGWEPWFTLLQHCSPTIRHLKLALPLPSQQDSPSLISLPRLKSFVFIPMGSSGPTLHLALVLNLLDIPPLEALMVQSGRFVSIDWEEIPNTVLALSVDIDHASDCLNLARFRNLRILRLYFDNMLPLVIFPTLQTIASSQRIDTIVVSLGYKYSPVDEEKCMELDSVLASPPLSGLRIVEIEEWTSWPSNFDISQLFPALLDKNLVQVLCFWYSRFTPNMGLQETVDAL